ncbi:hypothetical protein S140_47 [Shewanella sp. phage 1/40]|uniref:hypothetical protein n=1 Tax=Shewanella sp. phage 1/40 TaxID=1458860 RepID=UPI0004F6AF09|nr:hypothetical protein S140_47 [Shewanella sp. phage 1/40]AHK11457.1 hypothetical protein S140_47 [Shewanella sp. phage 1/40]
MSKVLDIWIEDHSKASGITHIMYHVFDEYVEGSIGTASIKVRFEDDTESGWYHPPSEFTDVAQKGYLFGH